MTTASLAEKIYFQNYYKNDIINPTDELNDYAHEAYTGGMTDNFRTGIFNNVSAIDINSSYPYQMIKAPLPTGI